MLKYCAVFSLCAGLGLAADFMTGQAARLVIGQSTFTSQSSGSSNTVLGGVGGVAFANDTLFVADANRLGLVPVNNRVLLYSNVSRSFPQPKQEIGSQTGRCPACVGQANVVLGQPDFTSSNYSITSTGMRLPTGVASDGRILAVADTANNRVLIWKSIPAQTGQPADIVLGQPDFTTIGPVVVNSQSFRAPEGLWVQNGKLFVADTVNNRVLIWNSIPSKNNQPADLVLGQPNFTTAPQLDLTKSALTGAANTMLNPTSVTSDGIRLYVSDLGFNRVLIWNSIPTKTQQAADVVVGQKDFATTTANANTDLCASGTDSSGNPIYPSVCAGVLSFPRFALSDGKRLYIADGGNDRVLIFSNIPTQNGARAEVVLGQPDEFGNDIVTSNASLFTPNLKQSASDVTPSPTSLAWDGQNLYVTDPTNYRILVFTPAEPDVPVNGVVNAFSLAIYAQGSVALGGTITANNTVTVTINGTGYTYTVKAADTLDGVAKALANLINANSGDPSVLGVPQAGFNTLQLIARTPGSNGNNITLATSVSTNATITAGASSSTLFGGGNAATLAPGSLIAITGTGLADLPDGTTVSADLSVPDLPVELAGAQVYIDGYRAPLISVSNSQITTQLPFAFLDTNSSSLYVRIKHTDGSVSITTAVGLPIALQNPGILATPQDPRQAVALHESSYATGVVSVDGIITAGNIVTVSIEDRAYSYTALAADTLASLRDRLIQLINSNSDEKVVASQAGSFTRIRLRAKVPGPDGNGIAISASATGATSGGTATVTMTATSSALCCANVAGAPITGDNPAIPGETILIYATGLGLVGPDQARTAIVDGSAYAGPALNDPTASVSSLVGGSTANVLSAGLKVGMVGVYEVVLELNSSLSSNPLTQVTISQDIYTSNIVTINVASRNP